MQNNMGKGRIKQGIITDEKCVTGKINSKQTRGGENRRKEQNKYTTEETCYIIEETSRRECDK